MSSAWKRLVTYFLNQSLEHAHDWTWFDANWSQIERTWQFVCRLDTSYVSVRYFQAFAVFLERRGLWAELLRWGRISVFGAQSLNMQPEQGHIFGWIGTVHTQRCEFAEALRAHQAAMGAFQAESNSLGESDALVNIGLVHHRRAELNEAINCYTQSLAVIRQAVDREREAGIRTSTL